MPSGNGSNRFQLYYAEDVIQKLQEFADLAKGYGKLEQFNSALQGLDDRLRNKPDHGEIVYHRGRIEVRITNIDFLFMRYAVDHIQNFTRAEHVTLSSGFGLD